MRGKGVSRETISNVSRRITQRPEVIIAPPLPYMFVTIEGGNTLDSGQDGVIWSDTEIDEVPDAYDPNVDTSFIDGIGRGTLYINGIAQDGYVLVVNDTRGVNFNAVIEGESPWTGGPVQIPVDGGGFVSAYLIC